MAGAVWQALAGAGLGLPPGDPLRADALPVGEEHGLPLVRFPLERPADAHQAVENGTVGKVLVDVTS
ncbi:hypothetical protein [Streptomyces sp. NPDC048106]|uniref:hypothetical protein n=1 Tax=Streptomyces sp. NPDC048106 TaxID=3155750 RepID=UPI003451FD62